jgi:hypothetical protein
MALSTIEAPLFDGTNYSSWRENMKQYFKSRGSKVWNSIVSKPWDLTTSKNLSNITVQRRVRKNNEVALNRTMHIHQGFMDEVRRDVSNQNTRHRRHSYRG